MSGAGITRVAYLDDSQCMPALDLCRGGPRDTVASHLSKKGYGATYRSLRFRVVEGGTTSEGAVASGYVLRSFDCQGALAEDDSSRRQQLAGGLSRHSCRFAFRGGLRRCNAPLACIRGKDPLARYTLSNFRLRRGSASRFLCTVLSFRATRSRGCPRRNPSGSRKG